jgi:RNA polymerase-binding transcription factor DksA
MKNAPLFPPSTAVPKKWVWHYATLLKVRSMLLREREGLEQSMQASLDSGGARDPAATQSAPDDDLWLTMIRIEELELREVELALNRILDGRYGICENTGKPIEAVRLGGIPWTRFSHDAAVKMTGNKSCA